MTVREIMGNKRMRRNHDAISVISWITIALLIIPILFILYFGFVFLYYNAYRKTLLICQLDCIICSFYVIMDLADWL